MRLPPTFFAPAKILQGNRLTRFPNWEPGTGWTFFLFSVTVKFSSRELLFDEYCCRYKEGHEIKNEKYAKTLEKNQEDPNSFYNGELAKDIALDIKRANGTVSESDLSSYQTVERESLESELSGMKMYLTPPPSSGAVLGLILNILKGG